MFSKRLPLPDFFTPSKWLSILIRMAILAVLLAAIIKYFWLNFDSGYWFDELFSLNSSYQTWNLNYLLDIAKDSIPIGHYFTVKVFTLPFTEKAPAARVLSGIFFFLSVLTLVIIEKLSWRSLAALTLISLSPGLLYFSTEIRPYASKILFYFLSTYFFQSFLSSSDPKKSQRQLIFWGVTNFIGLSQHYTFISIPVIHIVIGYLICKNILLEKLLRRESILPLALCIIPLAQLFITEFSRFNPTQKETNFPLKIDWLIAYYRPGLNMFVWYYLALLVFVVSGYSFLLLNHYHEKKKIPSWFSFIGLTGVGTYFISLAALPFIDTLYPRYQMFFYIGLIFALIHWVFHGLWAKIIFALGTLLLLLTSLPFHQEEVYLSQRKFFKEVGTFIKEHSESHLCIVTNGDWTLRYYIPTLSKIYHKPIQAINWYNRTQCQAKNSYNLFHNYEALPGKVLYHSELWSLSTEEAI